MIIRYSIFLTAFLLITMSSCNSSNATDFKESLDQSERKAFNIIVGKKGSGEKNWNISKKKIIKTL